MQNCLYFSKGAFIDLWYYVQAVETEICGIGRIQRDKCDIAYVSDIIILPQEVGAVDANVTAQDMEQFFDTIDDKEKAEWCFHWHTHPKFGVCPSATDLRNWTQLTELFEVFVPMIFNQFGDYYGRIHHTYPVKGYFEFENLWIYEWRTQYERLANRFKGKERVEFILSVLELEGFNHSQIERDWLKQEIQDKVRDIPTLERDLANHGYTWSETEKRWTKPVQSASEWAKKIQEKYGEENADADDPFWDTPSGTPTATIATTTPATGKVVHFSRHDNPYHWTKDRLVEEGEKWGFTWIKNKNLFVAEFLHHKEIPINDMKRVLYNLINSEELRQKHFRQITWFQHSVTSEVPS